MHKQGVSSKDTRQIALQDYHRFGYVIRLREKVKLEFARLKEMFATSKYVDEEMRYRMSDFELVLDHRPVDKWIDKHRSMSIGQCSHKDKKILLHPLLLSSGESRESVSKVMVHELSHACLGPGKGHGKQWTNLNERMGGWPEVVTDPELFRPLRDLVMRSPPKRQTAGSSCGLAVTLEATCSYCDKPFGLSLSDLDMLAQCPNPKCEKYLVPAFQDRETWHTHRATCPAETCRHILGVRFRQLSAIVECPKCEGRFVPLTEPGTETDEHKSSEESFVPLTEEGTDSDEHQSSEGSFIGDAGLQDMCTDTAPDVLVGGVRPSGEPQMCCPKPRWIRHFVMRQHHLAQFWRMTGNDETIQVPALDWSPDIASHKDWGDHNEWFNSRYFSAVSIPLRTNKVSSATPLRRVIATVVRHVGGDIQMQEPVHERAYQSHPIKQL